MTTEEKENILKKTGGAPIRKGSVYVIESFGYYKIGSTQNLKTRLQNYDTHNPQYQLCLSFQANDCTGFEKVLHNLFRKKRIHHEWFKLDLGDFEKILELNDHLFDKIKRRVISKPVLNKRVNKP